MAKKQQTKKKNKEIIKGLCYLVVDGVRSRWFKNPTKRELEVVFKKMKTKN